MKILFQGGYNKRSKSSFKKKDLHAYLDAFARQLIESPHQVVLTNDREYENRIAEQVLEGLKGDKKAARKYILYYLSDRITSIPKLGRVNKYQQPKYWNNERTLHVQYADCMWVAGGGKGTGDCMEKAFLSKKPVFIAYTVSDYPAQVWDEQARSYYYQTPGDAEFNTELNLAPEEYVREMFALLTQLQQGDTGTLPDHKTEASTKSFMELRNTLAEGKIDLAIARLRASAQKIDSGLANQLIILSAQYYNIQKQKNLGIGERSDEEARILLALLTILDELERNKIELE